MFALSILSIVVAIPAVICWIYVAIRMMQEGQTALGIICIVLCGIGALIAFIMGWVKSSEWNLMPVMLVWTACVVINLLIRVMMLALA